MRRVPAWLADRSFYYGWVVVVACFLATAIVFGMTYSFGVFLDPLATSFQTSTAQTSLVFGIQLLVVYVAAPPMGGIVEWLGAQRGLVIAAVLLGGGMVAGSQAGSLLVLILTYSIVTGMGMSLAFVIGYATPPQWFQKRRGMATALASAGLGIGMVVISPAASFLVTRIGWRGAFPLLGGVLTGMMLIAAFLIADHPDHVDAAVDAEFPDGRPDPETNWRDQVEIMLEAVRNRSFLVFFGGYVLLYMTLYVLLNHLVNFAADQGIREIGVIALSVIGGTTAITRLAVGGVADRLGRVAVFVVCGVAMAVALLILPLANTPLLLLALAVFFGMGYGGTGALLSAVPADLFGDRNLNTLFGLVSLSFAVPGLFGPFAAGLGFDRLGTYTPVFLVTGAVGLIGVGLVAGAAWLQGEL